MTNSSKAYIVIIFGGQHEDRWAIELAVSLDKQKAHDYMALKLSELSHWSKNSNEYETVMDDWQQGFREKNPEPDNYPSLEWENWAKQFEEEEGQCSQEVMKKLELSPSMKEYHDGDDKVNFKIQEVEFI